ncbi:hypothetical protein CRUP_020259 [Coryphaenoides rupestris]|nr:hypothetical protein CRUP_020259 [Coryphaenoides rupestris]
MVHTEVKANSPEGEGLDSNSPGELKDPNHPIKTPKTPATPSSSNPLPPSSRQRTIPALESVDEPVKLPFRIPPPPLASVDIDDEFVFSEPLPPPLEFANSIDIPDDQASAIAEMIQRQRQNGGPCHRLTTPTPRHL